MTYYTIKEFAALIKIHPETLRRLIRQKKIIAIKPGNNKTSHFRIPAIELERMALTQHYGEENGDINT